MKKSKFLLLGSVASLASIPFVAAKCGETKEEEKTKPEGDQKPGGDKNPETDKKPEGEKKPETDKKPEGEKKPEAEENKTPGENKTPEEDKEPSDEELSKEWKSQEETEGALTENEKKLIDKNIDAGITKDKNHIWGVDDEQGSRTNSGTKVQNSGDKSGTKNQGTGANSGKSAVKPMVRIVENATKNSEVNKEGDKRWKGVTPEDKKKAKESGEFWAEYWGLK